MIQCIRFLSFTLAAIMLYDESSNGQQPIPPGETMPPMSLRVWSQPADASIHPNGATVWAYRRTDPLREGDSERQVVTYSRPIEVAGDKDGNWLKIDELDGDRIRVRFRVELPPLDESQKAELAAELGGGRYSFVPLGILGYQVEVSNGGVRETVASRPPSSVPAQGLGASIPVSATLTNEALARLVKQEREGTQVEVSYYSLFDKISARGVSVTQFASNLESVLERQAGNKKADKIIVSQEIKREIETSLAATMSIAIYGYGANPEQGLALARELMDKSAVTSLSMEELLRRKPDLIVLGNEQLRLNLSPDDFYSLKERYSTKETMLKETKNAWNELYNMATESGSATEFNEKFNKTYASNNSFKVGIAAVVKAIPINFDLGSNSGRSGGGSSEVRLLDTQFAELQEAVTKQGEAGERVFKQVEDSGEGEILVKQLRSNLPEDFSLIDLSAIRSRSIASLSILESHSMMIAPSFRVFDASDQASNVQVTREDLLRMKADLESLRTLSSQLQNKLGETSELAKGTADSVAKANRNITSLQQRSKNLEDFKDRNFTESGRELTLKKTIVPQGHIRQPAEGGLNIFDNNSNKRVNIHVYGHTSIMALDDNGKAHPVSRVFVNQAP